MSPVPTTALACYLRKEASPNPLHDAIDPIAHSTPIDTLCQELGLVISIQSVEARLPMLSPLNKNAERSSSTASVLLHSMN